MSAADPPPPPPDPARYCGQCGLVLEPNAATCPRCGSTQAPPLPPPAWAAPAPPQPVRNPEVNGMAIASLVLGILWLYCLGSILAVIFGHIALKQIHRSGGYSTGRGMAMAGLILGYIGIAVVILVIALAISLHWFLPHPHLGSGVVV